MMANRMDTEEDDQEIHDVMEPTLWRKSGWIAQVVENDDEGWAVAMTRVGDDEPALVGPWTMGRDKKNPKPMDQSSFLTLVKTATEVLMRHEQAARARLHNSLTFTNDDGRRVRADLDIVPDDDDPHAVLATFDAITGELLRKGRVQVAFKLTAAAAVEFLRGWEE
jgi:hypothetical protein